jgi:hypothetical protein
MHLSKASILHLTDTVRAAATQSKRSLTDAELRKIARDYVLL